MLDNVSHGQSGSVVGRFFAEPVLGAKRVTVGAAQVIFEPSSVADAIYFVQRGQVRLFQVGADDTRLIEILGPEEWFGVGALARTKTHENRAVAVVPTILIVAPIERLNLVFAQRPEMALEMTRQVASKLQAARDDAARLVFEDCNQRLVRTLLHFSQSAASTPREDGVVLRITHNQLAQAIGVARETVSLALTQLRQQNLLRTGRNQLFFNPEALRSFRITAAHRNRSGNHNGSHDPVAQLR